MTSSWRLSNYLTHRMQFEYRNLQPCSMTAHCCRLLASSSSSRDLLVRCLIYIWRHRRVTAHQSHRAERTPSTRKTLRCPRCQQHRAQTCTRAREDALPDDPDREGGHVCGIPSVEGREGKYRVRTDQSARGTVRFDRERVVLGEDCSGTLRWMS